VPCGNLFIEDHIGNIMFTKLFNVDDLGDWMLCVTEEEERRNGIFLNQQQVYCPRVFQLDMDKVGKLIKLQPSVSHHNNNDGNLEEIKTKISVDPTLD